MKPGAGARDELGALSASIKCIPAEVSARGMWRALGSTGRWKIGTASRKGRGMVFCMRGSSGWGGTEAEKPRERVFEGD